MTERAQKLMDQAWDASKQPNITETKLIAAVLRHASAHVRTLTASKMGNLQVLDKQDMLQLADELANLPE